MNKIGLKLTKISAGVQELLTVNSDEWTRKVVDIRADLKLLSGSALENGEPVLMVSFTSKGSLITICHTIPGRSGDLVSAWIFIPVEINISATEEFNIIEMMKAELAKPQVEGWNYLEQYFSKEYPLKEPPYFLFKESSSTNTAAVRYYGTGTDFGLRELLGEKLYQSVYTEHRYVFLLDRNSGIIADDKLVNYTNEPIRETIVLMPPQMPANVTVKLNGTEFSKPTLGIRGEKIRLSFERAGFAPLVSEITAGASFSIPDPLPWQRCVKPTDFYITDNESNDLSASCDILIKGQRLTPSGINIPETECKALTVHVESPFCEPYSNTFNLMQVSPVHIVLKKRKSAIIYILNGQECPGLTECPKGYSYSETRKGQTIYRNCSYNNQNSGGKWKLFTFIGSAAALILGLVIGFLLCLLILKGSQNIQFGKKTKDKPLIETPQQGQNQEQSPEQDGDAKIYNCLSGDQWYKIELEKEPDLNGFYDDIIQCNTDKLLGHWRDKIDPKENKKWGQLLQALERTNPESLKGFHMSSNAQSVSINSYIQMMNNFLSKTKNTHNPAQSVPHNQKQPVKNTGGNNTID